MSNFKQTKMKRTKMMLACLAVAGLAVLNFTQSEKHLLSSSMAKDGSGMSAAGSSSSSEEPKKYGYKPSYYKCPAPSTKRQTVCGNIVLNGPDPECMDSDC